MNPKKIVNICLLLLSVFLYFVASQFAELAFDGLDIPITRDFWLTYPEMIGVGIGVLGFVLMFTNKTVTQFLSESVIELTKVVYPTREESSKSAVVVMIMVGVATMFLAFFDVFWSSVTRFVLAG